MRQSVWCTCKDRERRDPYKANPEILPLLYLETEDFYQVLFILHKEVDFVAHLVMFCKWKNCYDQKWIC